MGGTMIRVQLDGFLIFGDGTLKLFLLLKLLP
jgi:hypothetical protein